MNFQAIEQALVTMGKAILGVIEILSEQTDVLKDIREELKTLNNKN